MKRCVVFAGGPLSDCDAVTLQVMSDDYIIACDAGYLTARHFGVLPHLALGDFDSYRGEIDPAVEVITAPAAKDDTDTMLGLKIGLQRGCTDFVIVGGFGGRLDHTFANLQALGWLCAQGASGTIIANDNRAWVVRDGSLALPPIAQHHLSVFALGGICSGVGLAKVAYPLNDYTMLPTFPIGVSNEFTDQPAEISVRSGTLLVIASRDSIA